MKLMGAGRMAWASDFPHPDAIFPGAVDTTLEAWLDGGGVERGDAARVLWDNPLGFYRLDQRFV
jgi:predicted TIM-barrel fold metal-dependent hydrolase